MTKTKLIASLGSAVTVSILATPFAQASENPFAMQKVISPTYLAEGMGKAAEGKCSEGKCGDKMKEGGCNGTKGKMKEGSCNGTKGKMKEGKCGEGKCGGKMMEGGCNGSMDKPDTAQ